MKKYTVNPLILNVNEVEEFNTNDFYLNIINSIQNKGRIASYFVYEIYDVKKIMAVIVFDDNNEFSVIQSRINNGLECMWEEIPQLFNFEREIAEQFPGTFINEDFQPLRFHKSFDGKKAPSIPGDIKFYKIQSDEIHQVAVGPVHAGIIEPGHFRFQCYGEKVLYLEISLGYQHRGIEKSLIGGPQKNTFYKIQAAAGDTTIGHTLAYLMNIENLAGVIIDSNAMLKRMIALELERIANHVGDLGGLATDIGFLPTASYCGRIRGDFLNMTADICGNRFGRSLLSFGGEAVNTLIFDKILKKIEVLKKNLYGAVEMLWQSPSAMSRLENTGILPINIALELGIVGTAVRACNINNDIRKNIPFYHYQKYFIPVNTQSLNLNNDVLARGLIRWEETKNSTHMISNMVNEIIDSSEKHKPTSLAAESVSISFTEGFRGEICHTAITDAKGNFLRYKIVDPSFHNWQALAYVMRNEDISDFPLCNKSFSLSYCGFDL